jgi:hypothetical protein
MLSTKLKKELGRLIDYIQAKRTENSWLCESEAEKGFSLDPPIFLSLIEAESDLQTTSGAPFAWPENVFSIGT